MVSITVPKGGIIYDGIAAPQRNNVQDLPGGGNQVYIQMVDPSWIN